MSRNVAIETASAAEIDFGNVSFIPGWGHFDNLDEGKVSVRVGGRTRFLYCSRLVEHKGIDIAIDAAESLRARGLEDFFIDIYGAGQIAATIQRIKYKNLENHIFYRGVAQKEEILNILRNYDALVFPTWQREPFGFVVSEAAAAGCYPIMTAGIGASEWFLDGYDCSKIARDSASLCSAMAEMMLLTDEELARARTTTRKAGRERFSFTRWLGVIEKVGLETARPPDIGKLARSTKGVESAFLFLGTLLREALGGGP